MTLVKQPFTAKYKEILKLSSVGGMDGLSRFACLTPIFTFKKHRLTYYFAPMRNVRTGISYSPAAEAMSQPFFWGQEESISLLLGLGDGRQLGYLTHSSTG